MQYMAKRPLALRIDEDLLAQVDDKRGDVSRTRFVERALEEAVKKGYARKHVAAADFSQAKPNEGTTFPNATGKTQDTHAMKRQEARKPR